jgi:hypothetical protein
MKFVKNKVQILSHFGASKEVVVVEVVMEEVYVLYHFYQEAIQLDLLHQVLIARRIHCQKKVLMLNQIHKNILLQDFLTHLGLIVI